ncbi:hypothetical protein E2R51_00465 [Jeotgalibacillus sp. S-D1]|uniref:hypothetical protein n=1 Tax=Jeotgalibacillus sp. S-D1 TaxID=2552189 RepID=UPI00105924C4|nr:hypothetical protein [Jeotgalibacillus sp. S-D1]TDL34224.1 hypothetical protein E2R51_00465 [Jeotgalibacillus sp. S-D1]
MHFKKTAGLLILLCSCLLFAACSEENPGTQNEEAVSTEDKNKEAVEAVLKTELNVPNEEYVEVVKNIDKKMTDIGSGSPEANEVVDGVPSGVSDEWLAYEDLVKEMYGPYFTEDAFENLIPQALAFRYHYGYLGFDEDVQYKMNVSDIQVTKSENENSPNHYAFTSQVEYTNNTGDISQHEVKGIAILVEPGKMGTFEIRDDGGLADKVMFDQQ